ncbi:hypothetical protein ACFSE0_16550 [Ochrobactrum teleogrylli]
MDELIAAATRFRQAMERTDKRRFPAHFNTFPKGVCGEVALLLGTFLNNKALEIGIM